jgi:thiopeptide-type bacteriocin biosynthesis protein
MLQTYSFHPNLILRTPALPFQTQFDEHFIRDCLANTPFMEALYLASPDLHQECMKWQNGIITDPKKINKLLVSLTKYYIRAASRCTPFGLFAACSVVAWDNATAIQLSQGQFLRHTRLDMQYLCALAEHLSEKEFIRDELRYFPNSSIYRLGDEVRYIEYRYEEGQRVHQISSVQDSIYLTTVIEACKAGLKPHEIIPHLLTDSVTAPEALAFVYQLIEAHVLVSELEPAITGKAFLYQILDVLERIQSTTPHPGITAISTVLKEADRQIKRLDSQVHNSVEGYERIARLLQQLEVPIERNRLFQTDTIQLPQRGALQTGLQEDLLAALDVLSRISPVLINTHLADFKRRFYERYEDKEMPLLEVLDTENGIGYGEQGLTGNMPLIEDLSLPTDKPEAHNISQRAIEQLLYQKLREAEKAGKQTVELSWDEIRPFDPPTKPLPPSFAVLFRLLDAEQLLIEQVGGSSAVNMLARFAHADPVLLEIIQQITAAEQERNPDVVFAEIIHLPKSRVGNILLRPVLHPYEIPYISKSSLPVEQQISLQDLTISIRHNQLVLRSKRLNKVVVPRLSTAHNFTRQSMPIYQFLCDLQTDGLQAGLPFFWEVFCPKQPFYPRLSYRNTILCLASWQLEAGDFQYLLRSEPNKLPDHFLAFRQHWQLPRFFTLAENDNELLVDAENIVTVQAFLDAIKGQNRIRLKEFLFSSDKSVVTDTQGRPFVNQLITPLIRKSNCYELLQPANAVLAGCVQREFSLGSEWLYYKFYCGVQAADRILTEAIKPVTEELVAGGLIDKWFFIRYKDPDTHLRVRLHLTDTQQIGKVIQVVSQYMEPYVQNGYIWKTQTDTYRRELERYGFQTIELAETLFYLDSVAILDMLAQTSGDEREHVRWLWGIRAVDVLLQAFACTLSEKHRLLAQLRQAFAKEFKQDQDLKGQLDQKYRQYRSAIQQMLEADLQTDETYGALLLPLYQQQQALLTIFPTLKPLHQAHATGDAWYGFITSLIHMLINRLMPANQRLHELILYDFLFRQYQSEAARQKV